MKRRRTEAGQATVMIVGLATVLAMGAAVVTDASAAYLQRQGLDNLADGAALVGADLGASGEDVYRGGIDGGHLAVTEAQARAAVHDYLVRAQAFQRYPALTAYVDTDVASQSVRVRLSAPLHLPLKVPGGPESARIGATGAAVVAVDG